MNHLFRQFLTTSLLTTSMVASFGVFALEGITSNTADGNAEINVNEIDAITVSFSHPQSLSVSSPNNVANRAASSVINRTWHVVSNNAVTVKFTGRSPDAAGRLTNAPTFYKSEIGADGEQIGTQYDHLVTNFSASINNMQEGQGTLTGNPYWGGVNSYANEYGNTLGAANDNTALGYTQSSGFGYTAYTENSSKPLRIDETDNFNASNDYIAYGTPVELVNVAGDSFGTIMPDDNGKFSMTLSSRGVGDVATTQSGDYQITVVASFIAAELGNYSVVTSGTCYGCGDAYYAGDVSSELVGDLNLELYDSKFDASLTTVEGTSENSNWTYGYYEDGIWVDNQLMQSATVYGEQVNVSAYRQGYLNYDVCADNSDAETWCGEK